MEISFPIVRRVTIKHSPISFVSVKCKANNDNFVKNNKKKILNELVVHINHEIDKVYFTFSLIGRFVLSIAKSFASFSFHPPARASSYIVVEIGFSMIFYLSWNVCVCVYITCAPWSMLNRNFDSRKFLGRNCEFVISFLFIFR